MRFFCSGFLVCVHLGFSAALDLIRFKAFFIPPRFCLH